MGGGGVVGIDLSCIVEYPAVPFQEKRSILALASLKAPAVEVEESDRRAPIDVICVIDRSGSMAGSKLNLTKDALSFVIDQLDHRDSLGLVTYDTSVSTNLELLQMTPENRKRAKDAVRALAAGSMTNLSGGLIAGLDMAAKRKTPNGVCSVLLFTDGLANVGITAIPQITAATENKLKSCKEGTTVFTFGFGADHDPQMLQSIATAGKGMYYFIESVDQIPLSFADCIGGLQSVVAQNITLQINALGDAQLLDSLSKNFKSTGVLPGRTLTVSLGDLYSEEERDLLLRFELPPCLEPQETFPFCTLRLEYFSVLQANDAVAEATGQVARPATVPATVERHTSVDIHLNRLAAVDALDKSRKLADQGKLEEARQLVEDVKLQSYQSPSRNEKFTAQLIGEMDDVLDSMGSESSYKAAGRNKLFSKMQSHGIQRSADAKIKEDGGMYENKAKAAKKKAFLS